MEQKLSALIVDDEESVIILLKKLLKETQFFYEIRMAQSVSAAYIELAQFNPDLIFLDIKMPGKDGFSFFHELPYRNINSRIVFVTAYDQFAIKAIKNQAFDYLLKPVNRKELKDCIIKFIKIKQEESSIERVAKATELKEKLSRIKVNTRTGTVFINPSSILYCKADGNYTIICTGQKLHLSSLNLGRIAEQLPKNGFIRVGRSYIINFEYIIMLDRKESQITLMRDGESAIITIPRRHIKDIDII
ncbi:MAG TPA: LytTR family DNA-binding domain-containing protein [Bacteroidales bacterium]